MLCAGNSCQSVKDGRVEKEHGGSSRASFRRHQTEIGSVPLGWQRTPYVFWKYIRTTCRFSNVGHALSSPVVIVAIVSPLSAQFSSGLSAQAIIGQNGKLFDRLTKSIAPGLVAKAEYPS